MSSRQSHGMDEPSPSQRNDAGLESQEASNIDKEKALGTNDSPVKTPAVDIEHEPVTDDPRAWSSSFKWYVFVYLTEMCLSPR